MLAFINAEKSGCGASGRVSYIGRTYVFRPYQVVPAKNKKVVIYYLIIAPLNITIFLFFNLSQIS